MGDACGLICSYIRLYSQRGACAGWSIPACTAIKCGANMQLILLYSLKDGACREDFHDWVRTVDYPAMRGLSRVESFKTYETKKLLMGAGTPSVAYVEVFDVPDFDGFMREDLIGEKVQNIMGQFMGFANAPEFMICEEVV